MPKQVDNGVSVITSENMSEVQWRKEIPSFRIVVSDEEIGLNKVM